MLPDPSRKSEVGIKTEELDIIRVISVGQMTPNSVTGAAQGRRQRVEEGGGFLDYAVVRKRKHPVDSCDWLPRFTSYLLFFPRQMPRSGVNGAKTSTAAKAPRRVVFISVVFIGVSNFLFGFGLL